MDKRVANADVAIEKLFDGAVILSGGFGTCGVPENLIAAVRRKGTKNLTVASNNAGTMDAGLGLLLQTHQIKKNDRQLRRRKQAFRAAGVERRD